MRGYGRAVLVACFLAVSCGPEARRDIAAHDDQAQRSSEGLRRLEAHEIASLVRGSSMTFARPDADGATLWMFACDGEWQSRGGLPGQVLGAYTIEEDALCVDQPGNRSCHGVFVSDDGMTFVGASADAAAAMIVNRVQFQSLRSACS
jgi:hypothetical protein